MELSVRVQTEEVAQQRPTGARRPGPAPPPRTLYGKLPPETSIPRPTEIRGPISGEIGSIQRELQRAAGLFSFEGDPDPPDELRAGR